MARKLAVGETKVTQCVNVSRQNADRIRQIVREGVDMGARAEIVLTDVGVTYIHPCISEAGKLAAETKITYGPEGEIRMTYGFFDPIMMCYYLRVSGLFTNVKCAPELGIARVDLDGKTVMVFDSGRINIRRARSKRDVIHTLRLVARTLWGGIICGCCGSAGVDCASGGMR
jgi:hypothetical protein